MQQVTVSSKYQIVIPKSLRTTLHLRKGRKLNIISNGQTIVLVPDVSIKSLKGFLPGLNSDNLREKRDREV